jgi:hypothetical protein
LTTFEQIFGASLEVALYFFNSDPVDGSGSNLIVHYINSDFRF